MTGIIGRLEKQELLNILLDTAEINRVKFLQEGRNMMGGVDWALMPDPANLDQIKEAFQCDNQMVALWLLEGDDKAIANAFESWKRSVQFCKHRLQEIAPSEVRAIEVMAEFIEELHDDATNGRVLYNWGEGPFNNTDPLTEGEG